MNIEIICKTLIIKLFLQKGILESIKQQYNLEDIGITYLPNKTNTEGKPRIILNIVPPNTNYKLYANYKIEEGKIIFNIKNKDDSDNALSYSSEYKIENNTIKHVYKLSGSKPPYIHNTSVFSTNFVKFSNPYYTVNELLRLIRKSDKPNLIRTIDSFEVVENALTYVRENYTESMLRELRLDNSDISNATKAFQDPKSKKTFDNKLRLKFAYYSRFMRRNIKIYYPEHLHEIPQTKENFITNNFYTNVLATRYGDYYDDIRQVFIKKNFISRLNDKFSKVEEYIKTLDFRFQKPFTTTDIFLHYFGKKVSSMEKYNLTTDENVLKLLAHVELTKSIMFSFVSLYMNIPNRLGTNTINLNFKIHQIYPCLSWTKTISSEIISEINAKIDCSISKTKTQINISECSKKCEPLKCFDVIEIPYKNEILPISTKKIEHKNKPQFEGVVEQIYKSLENNTNIPLDVYKNSIEGAFLSGDLNSRFLASLRKRYYEMDDFTNTDETVYVSEYTEVSEQDYAEQFPEISRNTQESMEGIDDHHDDHYDDHYDDDIESSAESESQSSKYLDILKPVQFKELEETIKVQAEYMRLLIEKLKLHIEYNKLNTLKMAKSKQYYKIKLQMFNLKKETKAVDKDLQEETYINYEEELNPDEIHAYYEELEQYRDELYSKLYDLKIVHDKLFTEYNELNMKMKKIGTIFIVNYETKIRDLIGKNPDVSFKKSNIILELEAEERKTRLIIESTESVDEEEDISKGKQAFDELTDEKDIDIGYGSSFSRLKEKILGGLSDVAKGLIAVKNKAMKTEIELPLKSTHDEQLLDTATKQLQLKQEQALKRIEEKRQEQIEKFTREDIRFKSELDIMETELSKQRELEEKQQEIENETIIRARIERLKLNQTIQNDEMPISRYEEMKIQTEKELERLAEAEKRLIEQIEIERSERALSWESKIRELEQYIESQQAKLDKIPIIHKYRYTIYKLTILIKNAQRLLDNEIALRRYNEKIYRLSLDYEIARQTKKNTKESLNSQNKQLRRIAFNAVKNETILKESIEEIEKKMETIKKFIKAQRIRLVEQYKIGLIKELPAVDEALLKHKNELIALIKKTKEKIKL